MYKRSAGILAYRKSIRGDWQVLLVHPGGPFFQKKDKGHWSIPKGEFSDQEEPIQVAKREFQEETGNVISAKELIALSPVRIKSGKEIRIWAVLENFEPAYISSNTFSLEWPPRSGKVAVFPEVDKAAWFTFQEAKEMITPGQLPILEELEVLIGES